MTEKEKEAILKSDHFARVEIVVPHIKNMKDRVKPYSIFERKGVSDFMLYNLIKFMEYGIEYIKQDMVTHYEEIDREAQSKVTTDNIIQFPKERIKHE